MSGGWRTGGLLAVALGLGVLAGGARAQAPAQAPAQGPTSGVMIEEEECPECQTPIKAHVGGVLHKIGHRTNPDGTPRVQRHDDKEIVALGNRRPAKPCILCYSHINDYTCGSLKTDTMFILGSCRWFYGEKCLKGPPPAIPPLQKDPVTPENPLRR